MGDLNYIAFHDPAYENYETPGGSSPNTCNKFRVDVHIHDAEKAWPVVARILNRPDSPFPLWKFAPENPYRVGAINSRTRYGGQFTLYSLSNDEVIGLRFKEENIARVLQEINIALANNHIRPGIMPDSDIEIPGLPFSGYRYDLDRNGKHYEGYYQVTAERRQEYYNQPRYRQVCQLLRDD
ncbi:MAG: hypothetical protein ACR2PT_07780 [Endozoicomonas sp.]